MKQGAEQFMQHSSDLRLEHGSVCMELYPTVPRARMKSWRSLLNINFHTGAGNSRSCKYLPQRNQALQAKRSWRDFAIQFSWISPQQPLSKDDTARKIWSVEGWNFANSISSWFLSLLQNRGFSSLVASWVTNYPHKNSQQAPHMMLYRRGLTQYFLLSVSYQLKTNEKKSKNYYAFEKGWLKQRTCIWMETKLHFTIVTINMPLKSHRHVVSQCLCAIKTKCTLKHNSLFSWLF